MNANNASVSQVSAIERRLALLERSVRFWRLLGLASIVVVCCVGADDRKNPSLVGKLNGYGTFDTVFCKQIMVVNEDYETACSIACSAQNDRRVGPCFISVRSEKGSETFIIGGEKAIGVTDEKGNRHLIR